MGVKIPEFTLADPSRAGVWQREINDWNVERWLQPYAKLGLSAVMAGRHGYNGYMSVPLLVTEKGIRVPNPEALQEIRGNALEQGTERASWELVGFGTAMIALLQGVTQMARGRRVEFSQSDGTMVMPMPDDQEQRHAVATIMGGLGDAVYEGFAVRRYRDGDRMHLSAGVVDSPRIFRGIGRSDWVQINVRPGEEQAQLATVSIGDTRAGMPNDAEVTSVEMFHRMRLLGAGMLAGVSRPC